jgi:hypothetical protein
MMIIARLIMIDMDLQTFTERYKYREENILYIVLRIAMRKRGEGT